METKFRGQRSDNGEMVYGYFAELFNNKTMAYIMPNCYFSTRDLGEVDNDGNMLISDEIALGGFVKVIPETVGQFINIHDKNKVDIYSDDLLSDGEKTFRIYSVAGGFAIKAYPWCDNKKDLDLTDEFILMPCAQTRSWIENSCEVIGNIHTNPELLTVKTK